MEPFFMFGRKKTECDSTKKTDSKKLALEVEIQVLKYKVEALEEDWAISCYIYDHKDYKIIYPDSMYYHVDLMDVQKRGYTLVKSYDNNRKQLWVKYDNNNNNPPPSNPAAL
jgi:hypothetical protein